MAAEQTLSTVRVRTPSRQIVGIDLLRFAAAVLVVLYHLCFYDWTPRAGRLGAMPHTFDALRPLLSAGWVAVDVFFVISGYVIAFSAAGARAGSFLASRALRLVPAAMLCAALTAAVQVLVNGMPVRTAAWLWGRSVLFQPLPTIDASYWTMTVEVSFYLLVFLLLLVGAARRMPAAVGAVGVVSTAFAAMQATQRWLPAGVLLHMFVPLQRAATDVRTLVLYGAEFAVGVLLWECLHERWTWPRGVLLAVCGAGSLLGLVLRGNQFAHECAVRYRPALPAALWVAAVLAVVASVRWNAAVHRAMGGRGVAVSRVLGLCTYPLYLLHHDIGAALVLWWRPALGVFAATAAALAVVAALAAAVTLWLEPALRGWMRRGLPAGLTHAGPIKPVRA